MELPIADMKVTMSTTAMMRSMMAQGADTSANTQMLTDTILTKLVTKVPKAIDVDQRMPEAKAKVEKADKEVVEEEVDPGVMVLVVEKVEDDAIMPKALMVLAAVAEVAEVERMVMLKAESTVKMVKAAVLLILTTSTTLEKPVRTGMVVAATVMVVMVPQEATMAMEAEEKEVMVQQKEAEYPVGCLAPSPAVVDAAAKVDVGKTDRTEAVVLDTAEVGVDEEGSLERQARPVLEDEAVEAAPSLKMGEEDEGQVTSVKAKQSETEEEAVEALVAMIHNKADGEDAVVVSLALVVAVMVPVAVAMVAVVMVQAEAKAGAAVEDQRRAP